MSTAHSNSGSSAKFDRTNEVDVSLPDGERFGEGGVQGCRRGNGV